MGKLEKLALTWRTVRHMTPRQWFYRGCYALRPAGKLPENAPLSPLPLPLGFGSGQPGDLTAARDILNQTFPLVSGYTVHFPEEVDWSLPQTNYRLQCFRLNSFDFLHTLSDACAQTADTAYIQKGLELMAHWHRTRGQAPAGDKWNAYPTAQRIANWIGFASCYAPEQLDTIAGWIADQAQVLAKNVEYHLGANHLLTQGKALMYAGAFLKDDSLYRQGKRLLEREYPVQFLADGAHYEGSLSYHIEALQQYLESVLLMAHRNDPDWKAWAGPLKANYQYLSALLGANGTIPLYNDSAFDYCVEARDFLATSALLFTSCAPGGQAGPYCRRWQAVSVPLAVQWNQPQTGLYGPSGLFADHFEGHSFYLRCGDLGPQCNLGHAHADQLSLLWQTREGEIFADSGVFTYQSGPLRDACRATAAHNTVEIDGRSSAEVWAAFRTARRGRGKVIAQRENSITASHDGYAKILGDGLICARSYKRAPGKVTITDTLTAKEKTHSAVLRYHLASDCSAELLDDHRVLLRGKYILECSGKITLEPCRIAGAFGILEDSLCLTARWQFSKESTVTTVLHL